MINQVIHHNATPTLLHFNQVKPKQSGFTLIELMVVLMIIAILAALALPSYRQYMIKNAESQAQSRIKQLQLELETWRATNLTYQGFYPKRVSSSGTTTYAYSTAANQTIDVPTGSGVGYTITLGNMAGNSLVPSSTAYNATSNAWQMTAVPYGNLVGYGANTFSLNSLGLACKSNTATFTTTMTACPTGAVAW